MPPMPPMPGANPMGGTGPAMMPHPMMGAAASGLSGVRTALEALQKALPQIPMGSDLHTAVLKAVTDISKHIGDGGGDQASTMQTLQQMARAKMANPQAAALQGMMGGQQAPMPPAAGGEPPQAAA